MKKLICLLVMMILLSGFAFADEPIKEICYYPRDFDWGRFWLDWNKGVKEQMSQDLPLIVDTGFNTVRLIIQPQIVGYPRPSKEFLADFNDALALLEKFGLKAHVTLFDFDYFYPHARNENEEQYELKIERVIADSKEWIDDFMVTFCNDKRIAVWELYNEIILYHIRDGIVTKEPVVRAHRWLKEMFPYLKKKSSDTPCTVSVSFVEWLNDIKLLTIQPDIYNLHWYPNDWTGPFPKVLDRAYEIIGKDKRLMIGEFGRTIFASSEKFQMNEYHNMLYYTNQKGVVDIAIWTFNDFPAGRKKYIINHDGTEEYVGLPDADLNLGIYKIAEENILRPKPVVGLLQEAFSGKVREKKYNQPSFVTPDEGEECKNAGGKIMIIKECDGSESTWCKISEKEQCYADQVKNGRCTVGRYDEEAKGIVGISPRVLCDKGQ